MPGYFQIFTGYAMPGTDTKATCTPEVCLTTRSAADMVAKENKGLGGDESACESHRRASGGLSS